MAKCYGCFKDYITDGHCPHCGYKSMPDSGRLLLPEGTALQNRYIIGRVLGKPGGFGITYLGFNQSLETLVAIKEYLPREMVARCANGLSVEAHSQEDTEGFHCGLEQFLSEARILAKFDHANIVRVIDFFKENNTAYLIMHYYQGVNLNEYLLAMGSILSEQAMIDIMMPILDGLREVHAHGILHRDIKPQNIYLTQNGRPILLDFGNARQALGERNNSLSVIMTPGFAPTEQYSRKGRQGPWTDIYGCAATMYYMLTGQVPIDALERVNEDLLESIVGLENNVSSAVCVAIMKGLALQGTARPQSVEEFQSLLLKSDRHVSHPLPVGANFNNSQAIKLQEVLQPVLVDDSREISHPLPVGANLNNSQTLKLQEVLQPVLVDDYRGIPRKKVGMLFALIVAFIGYIVVPWGQSQPDSVPVPIPVPIPVQVQVQVQVPSSNQATEPEKIPPKENLNKIPVVGEPQYKRYTNARYGFVGDYPEEFNAGDEQQNGVGTQFISPDGQAKLMMYGSNSVPKDSMQKEYQNMVAEKGNNVGYHTSGDTWYVVSWEDNGRVYYHKTLSGKGSENSFEMNFPKQHLEYYSKVITYVEANFKTGDLRKGH